MNYVRTRAQGYLLSVEEALEARDSEAGEVHGASGKTDCIESARPLAMRPFSGRGAVCGAARLALTRPRGARPPRLARYVAGVARRCGADGRGEHGLTPSATATRGLRASIRPPPQSA